MPFLKAPHSLLLALPTTWTGRNSVDGSVRPLDREARTLIGRDRTDPNENANSILDFLNVRAFPSTGKGVGKTWQIRRTKFQHLFPTQ